jgi:hypothetical protein
MNKNQNTDIIKTATQKILSCGDAIGVMYEAVHEMYEVYSSISGVTIQNQNMGSIFLDSGKAISTVEAAHCLLEMVRTTQFMRGIKEAFDVKIAANTTNKPITILYAGTGPYATLVTPLLQLYSPLQLQVDLLDINADSLDALQKITNSLELGPYIGNVYCTDATTFVVPKHYDVVISETMQAALKKEPQVAIMQNLIPQCPANTIFIPEEITVTAEIVSRGKWNSATNLTEDVRRIELGEVVKVNNENLKNDEFKTVFPVASTTGNSETLFLNTSITVYGNHRLNNSDCSLTLPLRIYDLTGNQAESVSFWYEQGNLPGVRFQFSDSSEIYSAIGRKDYQPDLTGLKNLSGLNEQKDHQPAILTE